MIGPVDESTTVSVVIPVYNGAGLVAEAIESAFAQTLPPHEVIVVDDGSTDGTADVVRRFSAVRFIQQPNAGPAAARNTAIRAASGNYIAPLDSDDLFPTERLETMAKALSAHPDAPYVAGRQRITAMPGAVLPYWLKSTDSAELKRFRSERNIGCLLIRRSAFDRVGLIDASMTFGGDDIDWVLRCADLGLVAVEIEEDVLIRRLHSKNLTMDESKMQQTMFAILRRRAQRRRVT